MKTTLTTCCVAVAALLAGAAWAGNQPHGDAPNHMRSDTDGDGRISRAEAQSASAEKSGEWFDKLDTNKDGYVTQEEMRQARDTRREHMRSDMKEKADQRFKEADANNDGSLSLDEVQAKMPRMAERFSQIDQDKNGLLSRDELKRSGPRRGSPPPAG